MSLDTLRPLIVILHYGDPAVTRRLADQLAQSDPDIPALVLDNAAPDPYPGAWERLSENRYWAGALAQAAIWARARGNTHLWFCNNDILFMSRPPHLKKALGRLARLEAALGRVGMYSPAFAASPYHPQMVATPSGGQYRLVGVMDGVAPLISLDGLDAVGGVDAADNPYGYGVDIWLSSRLHQAGWKLVVDQTVVVRHRHHTAARRVSGFLEIAARAEEAYMARRLGPGWRERVKAWQAESVTGDRL